jgi:hypothetical protein
MRLSLVSKTALSERCPDRSSHPITLVKRPAVENPWTARPGQVSRKLTTSAVAIVMFERIDDTPAGSCQTHVVLRCLAVVGQWLRVQKGDCMYGTAASEARGEECSRGSYAVCLVCECGRLDTFFEDEVNSRSILRSERFSESPTATSNCGPFSGSCFLQLQKRFVAHSRGLCDWDQWSAGI